LRDTRGSEEECKDRQENSLGLKKARVNLGSEEDADVRRQNSLARKVRRSTKTDEAKREARANKI
jgi:hypothetical protein